MSRHPVTFPWRIDAQGRTAGADDPAYVRSLVELVLMTAPGERLNRPGFGGGLQALLFEPVGGDLTAAALRVRLEANLLGWLGDQIALTDLAVEAEEAALRILSSQPHGRGPDRVVPDPHLRGARGNRP
jgi:phage baseplate assembly protein W